MSELVRREGDQIFTTSEIVAAQAGVQHKNTLELINNNLADFEEFGRVGFEIRPRPVGQHGGGEVRIARLNDQQATLLLTYLKNTDKVRAFKKALVKAFFEMATQLRTPVKMSDEELMSSALIRAHAVLAERDERLKHSQQALAVAAPKAEAYNAFMDADGTYAMGDVAKMLGIGQNLLFQQLRLAKVLISDGARRNTPYQDYMKYFEVKAGTYEAPDGSRTPTKTTRVRPSGVDFIRRRLNLSGSAANQLSLSK